VHAGQTAADKTAGGQQGQGAAPDTRNRGQPGRWQPPPLGVSFQWLGIGGPDRDRRGEGRWAARALGAGDQVVATRVERGAQRVSNRGEFDEFGVDFGQLHPGARLQSGVRAGTGAKVADLQQVGDLVEGEAEELRGFDHPQHRDRVGRIDAVPAESAVRFVQQAASLVAAAGGGRRRAAACPPSSTTVARLSILKMRVIFRPADLRRCKSSHAMSSSARLKLVSLSWKVSGVGALDAQGGGV
jgi:hypothetical protein